MLFFLDVHRGPDHFFDDHGFECAGIEGAAHIAAEAAARIAPARASTHTDPLVFDVRSESGRPVLAVMLPASRTEPRAA